MKKWINLYQMENIYSSEHFVNKSLNILPQISDWDYGILP